MKADKVILKKDVVKATRGLRDWLKGKGDFSYNYPPMKPRVLELVMEDLKNLRPPIGQRVTATKVTYARPEFRQILHAGWISCHAGIVDKWPKEEQEKAFTIINRLCEQAIVQNLAVETGFAPDAEVVLPSAPAAAGKKAAKKSKKRAKKAARKERRRAGPKP
jgi:hypothetical protein